jgi:hypothetical protein
MNGKKIMNTRLNNLSDEDLKIVMNASKGKLLNAEQKQKFRNHYTKKIK